MVIPKIKDDDGTMITFADAGRKLDINISTIFIWYRDGRVKTMDDIRYCNSKEGRLQVRSSGINRIKPGTKIPFNRLKTCFDAGGRPCNHYEELTDTVFGNTLPNTCTEVIKNKYPHYIS